jgi:exopolysaccharide production protein ExoZ
MGVSGSKASEEPDGKVIHSDLMAIQVLRCLAAVLVVVWHSNLAIKFFAYDYWSEGDRFFRALHFPSWANHLSVGVDIFFCISGFIMTMLADRSKAASAGGFVLRRFARIFPPYWIFTALVILVYIGNPQFNVGGLSEDWRQNGLRIIQSILLIPQKDDPVLGVGWTLIHEFLFYYLVALLIFLKQGRNVLLFIAAAALISVALWITHTELLYGNGFSPYYVEFFAGALAYHLHLRVSPIYPEAQCTAAVVIYFSVCALMDRNTAAIPYFLIQVGGFGSMGFLSICGLIGLDNKYKLPRFFVPRLFARIGDASYSLYLSHWFVLSAIGKSARLIPEMPVPFIVIWQLTSVLLAIFIATVFAEYIELPCHRKILNWMNPSIQGSRRTPLVYEPVEIGASPVEPGID